MTYLVPSSLPRLYLVRTRVRRTSSPRPLSVGGGRGSDEDVTTNPTPSVRDEVNTPWKDTNMNISWACDICKKPVEDDEGWITISYTKIYEYEEAKRAWETEYSGPVTRASEYNSHPAEPSWHVWHKDCDPDIDSNDYTIDIERIRTKGKLLGWTAHLLEKNWFPHTNWRDIIRRTLTSREVSV